MSCSLFRLTLPTSTSGITRLVADLGPEQACASVQEGGDLQAHVAAAQAEREAELPARRALERAQEAETGQRAEDQLVTAARRKAEALEALTASGLGGLKAQQVHPGPSHVPVRDP